jgi:hypothetical protein
MKRVIIVPVSEIGRFAGMTVLARSGSIAALLGDSFRERSRKAFDSEEEFLGAVAEGRADHNTFQTVAEASTFAARKILELNATARRIEEAISSISSSPRKLPRSDDADAVPDQLSA